MPIYEYACRACGHQFETLLRSGETPACDGCGGEDLQKKLSLFSSTSEEKPSVACGTCGNPAGPGACSLD